MTNIVKTKTEVASKLPSEISISNDWIELRNRCLTQATKVEKIDNQIDFEDAEIAMKRCSTTSNKLEKLRKDFVKPINKLTKDIKKMTDDARAELEEEKARIKGLLSGYMQELQRKEQEERERQAQIAMENERKLQEFEEKVEDNPFAEFIAPPKLEEVKEVEVKQPVKTAIRTRTNWTYEIIDENLIPREFLMVDTVKLNKYVKEHKGNTDIAGVKAVEQQIIF